jgi:hypothetical protein
VSTGLWKVTYDRNIKLLGSPGFAVILKYNFEKDLTLRYFSVQAA